MSDNQSYKCIVHLLSAKARKLTVSVRSIRWRSIIIGFFIVWLGCSVFLVHELAGIALFNYGNIRLTRSLQLSKPQLVKEGPGSFAFWNKADLTESEASASVFGVAIKITDNHRVRCRLIERLIFVYLLKGMDPLAAGLFQQSCEHQTANYYKGVAYEIQGEEQAALCLWRNNPIAYSYLVYTGKILTLADAQGRAIKSWNLVIQAWPDRYEAYYRLAGIYWAIGDEKLAVALLKQAIQLDKTDSAQFHFSKGQIAFVEKDWKTAAAYFRQSIAKDPNLSFVHSFLGYTFLASGDLEEAEAEFKAELDLNPDYLWALLGLASIAQIRGEIDSAVFYYGRARSVDPHNDQVRQFFKQ